MVLWLYLISPIVWGKYEIRVGFFRHCNCLLSSLVGVGVSFLVLLVTILATICNILPLFRKEKLRFQNFKNFKKVQSEHFYAPKKKYQWTTEVLCFVKKAERHQGKQMWTTWGRAEDEILINKLSQKQSIIASVSIGNLRLISSEISHMNSVFCTDFALQMTFLPRINLDSRLITLLTLNNLVK